MTGLITDPGFDKKNTEEYKLSIQVSLGGFSFSVIHPVANKLLALEHSPATISSEKFIGRRFDEWLKNNEILNCSFAGTSVFYHTPRFTFIPSEFYDFEKQDRVASLVLGRQNGLVCHDNYFPNAKGNLVFSVPASLSETLRKNFRNILLQHPLTSIERKLYNHNGSPAHIMALFFTGKSFYLVLYSHGKLMAVNSFSFYSQDDVVFYTLSLLKQLKIKNTSIKAYLSGDITPDGTLHTGLKKYFSTIIFLSPEVNYDSEIYRGPLHRFLDLI